MNFANLDDDPVKRDQLQQFIEMMYAEVARLARINELERVRAATLDADMDVWSQMDDGKVVSLAQRIYELGTY